MHSNNLENGMRDVLERATELNVGTLYPYGDPQYQAPTAKDVRMVLKYGELTQSTAAKVVGVRSDRTIRKWVNGDREIPYAAWRLLLIRVGLA